MTDIIYDFYKMDLSNLSRHIKAGDKIICPICKSELLVVLDYSDIPKLGENPGVYCLEDRKHVNIVHKIHKKRN
jgi:hypothetical protein